MVTEATSLGFKKFMALVEMFPEPQSPLVAGTPSITYKGWLLALNEPKPRMLIPTWLPGEPEYDETCTPGAFPASTCSKLTTGASFMASSSTTAAEPEYDPFLTVP